MIKKQTNKNKWIVFSKELKNNGNFHFCQMCGCSEGKIDLHHIFKKTNYKSKYWFDEGIIISLCPKHHKFGTESAHGNPIFFADWLKENKPDTWNYVMKITLKEMGLRLPK